MSLMGLLNSHSISSATCEVFDEAIQALSIAEEAWVTLLAEYLVSLPSMHYS